MPKEYKTIGTIRASFGLSSQTIDELNSLSADGWEIVQVMDQFVVLERSTGKKVKIPTTRIKHNDAKK